MTFRNEIFEGIGAYKGVKEALGDTARDRYYEVLAKKNRIPLDEYEERKKAREAAIRKGRPATRMPQMQLPTIASTATPGAPPSVAAPQAAPQSAFVPGAPPAQSTPGAILNYGQNEYFRDGGMVKRKFDPEGPDYDQESADWEDVRPQIDPEDGKLHGMSRVPRTGLQLKGRQHPTWDKAIETDRRLGYGLEMRDGRYYTVPFRQKFADGGSVLRQRQREHLTANTPGQTPGSMEFPDDDFGNYENEADSIVKQLLSTTTPAAQADIATGRQRGFEQSLPIEPEPAFSPQGDIVAANTRDKVKALRGANQPHAPMAALETAVPPPSTPTGTPANVHVNARGVGDRSRMAAMQRDIPPPTDTPSPTPPEERSSKVGRAVAPVVDALGRAFGTTMTPEAKAINDLNGRINALVAEKQKIDPGLFEQTTSGERSAAEARIAEIDAEIAALQEQKTTRAQGVTPEGPSPDAVTEGEGRALQTYPAPYGPADPAPPGDPDRINQMSLVPRRTNQTPGGPPVPPAALPGQQGSSNGPSVPITGPTGTAAAPAPPPGSASANRPTGAPKPRKALNDQSRTEAFDPVADREMAGNVQPVDAGGRAYNPQEIQSVLAGAATLAPSNPAQAMTQVGNGSVTRQNFNQYVQQHSNGGAFSPGEAMLVGMLSDYKMLLSQGHVDQANKMAYGLIQAASLEAASYGYVARDAFKAGNYPVALQNVVAGANYIPDGMTFKVGPDGRSIIATNGAGQVTAQQAVTPAQLMGMITGLGSGQLIWQALQQSAAALTKPDKNAEGRALTNELRREQIIGARMRNKKLASGGGGTTGVSPVGAQLSALLSGRPPAPPQAPRSQGDDTSWIDQPVVDDPEPQVGE